MMMTETTVQCRYEFLGPGTMLKNTAEPVNQKLASRLCSCLVLTLAFRTVDAVTAFLQTRAVFETHTAAKRLFSLHSYPILVA